jgi:curli biogenesis system outer membrane secretion channel CsgG
MRAILIAAALLTGAAPAALATAASAQTAQAAAPARSPQFERDRQSILAQAGEFRVHFDMRENVSFVANYDPLEEQLSSGHRNRPRRL